MASSRTTSGEQERTRVQDDSDLLELPAIDGDDETRVDLSFEDEEIGDDSEESVGLDTSMGMEEPDDAFEDLDDVEGELASWEAADEPIEADPSLEDEDEGGWVSGSEAEDADFDDDSDESDEEFELTRDAGEEGVEERFDSESLDDAEARANEDGSWSDEMAEDLDLQEEAEVDVLAESEHPALRLERALLDVQWIEEGEAERVVKWVLGGDVVHASGPPEGPFRIRRARVSGELNTPRVMPVGEHETIFVVGGGNHVVVSVDGPGRVPLVSSDDGQTWQDVDLLRDAGAIAIADEAILYAAVFVEEIERAFVIRMPLDGQEAPAVVVDLGEPHRLGDQRVRMLKIEPRDGERELVVVSGVGVLRARI